MEGGANWGRGIDRLAVAGTERRIGGRPALVVVGVGTGAGRGVTGRGVKRVARTGGDWTIGGAAGTVELAGGSIFGMHPVTSIPMPMIPSFRSTPRSPRFIQR
ncbi:hypothetical protein SUS17_70 [Sphingomonas sp. S17]|nr:hypothetical protein SUS17_70 [Sphingomonas sp. S17]